LTDTVKWLIALAVGGGGGATWVAIRQDRREEKRSAPRDRVDTLQKLLAVAEQAYGKAGDALQKAASAERENAYIREELVALQARLFHLLDQFRPILYWIDSGAKHPPPEISSELRDAVQGRKP